MLNEIGFGMAKKYSEFNRADFKEQTWWTVSIFIKSLGLNQKPISFLADLDESETWQTLVKDKKYNFFVSLKGIQWLKN